MAKEEGPRSFARFIENVGDGDAHQDLSNELHELISKLQDLSLDTGADAKGELKISIRLKATPRGGLGIEVTSKLTVPKNKRPLAQAWITKGGNATFEHPQQTKLPLQEVKRRKFADDDQEEQPNV